MGADGAKGLLSHALTQEYGEKLSGVEIAATVFSNLREGHTLQAPGVGAHLLIIAVFGLVLGVVARRLAPATMLPLAAAMLLLYVAAALYAFSAHNLWLPLVISLFVQSPVAIGAGLYFGFRDARREREQLQKTFGYYLPPAVVAELCGAAGGIPTASRAAYAVCLFTDAERYTTLAEGLSPKALHALLNRYYDALFEPVRRHGGLVSDVVGDAMLALWATAGPDPETRVEACRAALEIMAGSPGGSGPYLPTRIGLHCGEVVLGNVGAGEHFEYRAVGDIVNTAQRIEDLNKRLGTRVADEATCPGDSAPRRPAMIRRLCRRPRYRKGSAARPELEQQAQAEVGLPVAAHREARRRDPDDGGRDAQEPGLVPSSHR
jgi:adenylate cyclase